MSLSRLRLAVPEEAERLGAIEIEAGQLFKSVGMGELAVTVLPAATIEAYRQAAARGDVFVIEAADGTPAGFAVLGLMDGEPYLAELDVLPAQQRRGFGRRLIEAAEAWARARGARSLLLSTFKDVPWNGPYYARLGFEFIAYDASSAGAQMRSQREREAQGGLDMARRVFMRKRL